MHWERPHERAGSVGCGTQGHGMTWLTTLLGLSGMRSFDKLKGTDTQEVGNKKAP